MSKSIAQKSLDQLSAETWSEPQVNGYVVRDYTGITLENEQTPVITVLRPGDLAAYLGDAARDGRKIAVYAVGECVIDWSGFPA